jgi:isoleucyl-tRNA synthetase
VVTADFVALDQGTGCVHIAPGHGEEDYAVGLKYNLPSPMPVDERGCFTAEAGRFEGLHIKEANDAILDDLRERGRLVWSQSVTHSYPHCWRCKQPLIFRATEQWFVSMKIQDLRVRALQAVDSVSWVPDWSIRRITGMVADRPDWCISRQRTWGVPIPVFYCLECDEVLATPEVLGRVETIFGQEGADAWFERSAAELLPEGTACGRCSGTEFRKESDILDVWFESGVSHAAVLRTRPELRWPADLYLEGSDQHRGWFQSSLLTSVGMTSQAPYRQVLTHGFLVDGQGRKMSKSLGNVVDPLKVIQRSGADILRLWVSSADYSSDIAVSDEILQRIGEGYRRIRNTLRFLLGSIDDFDPGRDSVEYGEMEPIDKWALMRLHELTAKVRAAYDGYKLHVIYHSIYNFCAVDMSSFYLDVLKDRLYTLAADAPQRRSAQTVLLEIAEGLVKLSAPILAFTAEEAWSYLPAERRAAPSVHLSRLPEADEAYIDPALKDEWSGLLLVRQEVSKALEAARQQKLIGGSLEAKIVLGVPDQLRGFVESHEADLPAIFIVSQVELAPPQKVLEGVWTSEAVPGLRVAVTRPEGNKCARCWNWREEVGGDDRHRDLCERCLQAIG